MSDSEASRLRHRSWRWLGRGLGLLLGMAVIAVLARLALGIDWAAVGQALTGMSPRLLLAATVMALTSHLLYGCLELLARRYTGHHLPTLQVLLIGTTSYAFNLSLGSVLGGLACRARLYTRQGLQGGRIARIFTFSLVSNWLGYLLLAGVVFTVAPPELPPAWGLPELASGGMRWLGLALLGLTLLYLGLCAQHGGRALAFRQHLWQVPNLSMALAQVGISVAHWASMGALLTLLLGGQAPYLHVLAVLLVAAVAGVLTHVPAGLGVLEAVFVVLLAHRLPATTVLAALVTYRLLFYLLPLVVGATVFLRMEAGAARRITE